MATALNNVAGFLLDQKKFGEAEPFFREALALRARRLGETHPDTLTTRVNLSVCVRVLGRYDEAERELLHAYRNLNATLGPNDRLTRWSIGHIVKLYEHWDKPDRAAEFRALLPATQPSTQTAAAKS